MQSCANELSTTKTMPNPHDTNATTETLNRVFSCLSDPSRRRIIALLREAGELKVGDIAQAFSMSLNGVSKHLKALEAGGLVTRRIEGRRHFIRVNWKTLEPAHTWLDFHRHFWSIRLDRLASHVEREHATKQRKQERSK